MIGGGTQRGSPTSPGMVVRFIPDGAAHLSAAADYAPRRGPEFDHAANAVLSRSYRACVTSDRVRSSSYEHRTPLGRTAESPR